jgi:Zn finger protein HypA/HybF involved in hydrogenase expression
VDSACVMAFGKAFKHLDAGELVLFRRAARLAHYYRHKGTRAKGITLKLQVIKALGIEARCVKCSYDRFVGALEFHHRDPTQKVFSVSDNDRSLVSLVEEARKCDLLCANCHREHHAIREHRSTGRRRSAVLEPQVAAYLLAVGVDING